MQRGSFQVHTDVGNDKLEGFSELHHQFILEEITNIKLLEHLRICRQAIGRTSLQHFFHLDFKAVKAMVAPIDGSIKKNPGQKTLRISCK